jgi:hypothetical protein
VVVLGRSLQLAAEQETFNIKRAHWRCQGNDRLGECTYHKRLKWAWKSEKKKKQTYQSNCRDAGIILINVK